MSNRSDKYYLEDVVFKVSYCHQLSVTKYSPCLEVDDQLFKVHRHLFVRLSPVFRDMFELPVPEGAEADGLSDNQPLVLEGVEKQDFVRLLQCIYPL